MNKFEIQVTLTFSKIMALLVLAGGVTSGLILDDASIVTLGITIGAALIGWKQGADTIKQVKNPEV